LYARSARVVLKAPKREHVFEALFGDDRFQWVMAVLTEVMTGPGFPSAMPLADVSMRFGMIATLGCAAALDRAQKRKRRTFGPCGPGVLVGPPSSL